jgi:hypothetical protein
VSSYRPTLAVHVVWHPGCAQGPDYGHAVFGQLFEDPDDLAAHGLRIPVRLWRGTEAGGPPPVPPLEEAERAALVLLLDDQLLGAPGWLDFLDAATAAVRPGDVLLGVALSAAAMELGSPLARSNLIQLHELEPDRRQGVLLNRLLHALCRLLGTGADGDRDVVPVRVFISHAKRDGVPIAQTVREYLQSGTGVTTFFDTQDLPEGVHWADVIRGAASENVLLAVRTDAYAGREWCRSEVLEAKLGGSPVIVVDALNGLESRGFPYLGNAPSLRWRTGTPTELQELLRVVLHETLRFRHFPRRVADLCRAYRLPDDPRVLPAPPELLTVLRARAAAPEGGRQLVYPDPPLGSDELALLRELAPDMEPVTPTTLIARR